MSPQQQLSTQWSRAGGWVTNPETRPAGAGVVQAASKSRLKAGDIDLEQLGVAENRVLVLVAKRA
jgi:hypothetical protein